MVNKFTTIKDRIVYLVEKHNIKKETFFTKVGATSANFRGNAVKTPLNSTTIVNILSEFPDVDANWLLTGKGNELKETKKVEQNSTVAGHIVTGSGKAQGDISQCKQEVEILNERIKDKDEIIALLKEQLKRFENKLKK